MIPLSLVRLIIYKHNLVKFLAPRTKMPHIKLNIPHNDYRFLFDLDISVNDQDGSVTSEIDNFMACLINSLIMKHQGLYEKSTST